MTSKPWLALYSSQSLAGLLSSTLIFVSVHLLVFQLSFAVYYAIRSCVVFLLSICAHVLPCCAIFLLCSIECGSLLADLVCCILLSTFSVKNMAFLPASAIHEPSYVNALTGASAQVRSQRSHYLSRSPRVLQGLE